MHNDKTRITWINPRRFRRLCMVLFLPLTLIGIIYVNRHEPETRYQYLLCQDTWCRSLGQPSDRLYESIRGDDSNWYSPYFKDVGDGLLAISFVEASNKYLSDVEIVDASATISSDYELSKAMASRVVGQKADLALGHLSQSTIVDGKPILSCGTVWVDTDKKGIMTAECRGAEWIIRIDFKCSSEDRTYFQKIRESIKSATIEKDFEYISFILFAYPMFFWMFLAISALIWLGYKSFKYVSRG